MEEWIRRAGEDEIEELRKYAKKLVSRSGFTTPEDLFQDLAVKDLKVNLAEKAQKANKPLKPYLIKSLKNGAIDRSRKMRPAPMPRLDRGDAEFEPEAPAVRAMDSLDRFELTMERLTDEDIDRAPKDHAILLQHGKLLDFLCVPPRGVPRIINILEVRAFVLAKAGAYRLGARSMEIARQWSMAVISKAMKLQEWATKPGRGRSLKKLVGLSEALVSAARAASRGTDLAGAANDFRRVAAVYVLVAFSLRCKLKRAQLKNNSDPSEDGKHRASRRNGRIH